MNDKENKMITLEDVSTVIEQKTDKLRFGNQVIRPNQKTADEYEDYTDDEEVIFPYED
jgi:hypothetical protein